MFDSQAIFHIGYVVKNMRRSVKTWEKNGANLIVPAAVDPIQNVECALFFWKDSAAIELVAPMKTGPNPVENRLSKGGGLDHICVFSDDLEADVEAAQLDGGMLVVPPCYGAVFDRNLAFIQTRLGLTVEYMTRKPVGKLPLDPLTAYFARLKQRA